MYTTTLAAKILEAYHIHSSISSRDIHDFKLYNAQRYAFAKILSFSYRGRTFYVSNDYSLNDDPEYLKDVIRDINPLVAGYAICNPTPQSDGATYALGLDGVEYYLWEDSPRT